jgi:S-sulfo-L-cysteine synthase (O-acetyl-L-serine-dependent)
MATSLVPGIYDALFPDAHWEVKTEEAYAMMKRLASEEGLRAGISSGAALTAGLQLASTVRQGCIVMIFPDGGSRYLDEKFRS